MSIGSAIWVAQKPYSGPSRYVAALQRSDQTVWDGRFLQIQHKVSQEPFRSTACASAQGSVPTSSANDLPATCATVSSKSTQPVGKVVLNNINYQHKIL